MGDSAATVLYGAEGARKTRTYREWGDITVYIVDHQLREQLQHISPAFPVTYFHDEMADLPNREGPVHWHPEFEIVTAKTGVLDYQVGEEHILLNGGDSLFVNTNMLHCIRQLSGEDDPMPGIVFLGTLIAPENSLIYEKYVHSVSACDRLPYVVFRLGEHDAIDRAIRHIYSLFEEGLPLYELRVQHELIRIFDFLNSHLEEFSGTSLSRMRLDAQIRVQKMLSYIFTHYAEDLTLSDISSAASISRSEAGRCFSIYMRRTPIEYLIGYRLQKARFLLDSTTQTIQEISQSCGFHSTSYFTRKIRQYYGYTPGAVRHLGK